MATVKGTPDHDDLLGTDDDDEILGLVGNDTLDGAGGDDTLIGGPGADTLIGNAGNDDFEVSGHAGEFDVLDGGDGYDRVLTIGTGAVVLNRFESAAAGIEEWRGRNLSILGNDDDNLLDFTATKLVDVRAIDGGDGNDTIIGSDLGDDVLRGGAGDDTVVGNFGDDDIEGGSGNDVLDGGRGHDKLFGGADDDTLLAGAGNDTLDGGGGNDVVDGGAGDDTVYGGRGDDAGVWAFAENVGARDHYDGGKGFDTLELKLSAGQALTAAVQDDMAAFQAFLTANGNANDLYGQTFTFTAFDLEVRNWEAIELTKVNIAPVAEDDAAGTDEDSPIAVAVLDNDHDVDALDHLTLKSVDTSGTLGRVLVNPDGSLAYDPGAAFQYLAVGETAIDTFTYTIEDLTGATATATVSIVVGGVNDAPTARDDGVGTDEDTVLNGDLFADNGSGSDGDPDASDQLVVSAVNGDAGSVGASVVLTSGAMLTVAADGTFVYDPAGRFERLAAGQTATETFEYTVSDGHGGSDTATVQVTVSGRNDAPTAEDDASGTDEDSSVTVAVLDNDGDADDLERLTLKSVDTSGTLGRVLVNSDGSLAYDPGAAFQSLAVGETAIDSFAYIIEDLAEATATATVSIVVAGVNDAPTAEDLFYSGTADGFAWDFQFVANDVDADDDAATLVYTLTGQPVGGRVVDNGDGTFRFDPGTDFRDLASGETREVGFTYTAADRHGAVSAPATVNIAVTGVNDAPTAHDDAAETDEDSPVTVAVLDNDHDVDALDHLTVKSVDISGTLGLVFVNPDGSLAYDPGAAFQYLAAGETAIDSFTYTIEDLAGATATATVSIAVTGVNDAPTARDDGVGTDENTVLSGDLFADNGSGPDGDPDTGDQLAVSAVNGDSGNVGASVTLTSGAVLTVAADGTFAYDPAGGFEGLAEGQTATDIFEYVVSDGHGGSDTAMVEVSVNGRNDAPTAENLFYSGTADGSGWDFPFMASDVDADDDSATLVYAAFNQPAGGRVFDNGDGTFRFDPGTDFRDLAAGETREVGFTYTATDRHGAVSAPATVTITVAGVNGAPTARDDGFVTGSNTVLSGDLFADNGSGPDGDPDTGDQLVVSAVNGDGGNVGASVVLTSGAVLTVADDGTFIYDPAGQAATDTFEYTVSDGRGGEDSATVTVTVSGRGSLDAFVANFGTPNRVWLNDGNGGFADSGQTLGTAGSLDVALGDLDGDGDLDAFVANFGNPNRVWVNDGSGVFTDSGQALGTAGSWDVALGDLDGDGDIDAFVANDRGPNRVWRNDGTGHFTDSGQALGNKDSWSVALGDLDGDGDLDAFVTNFGVANQVWVNDGNGNFTASGQAVGGAEAGDVVLGDLDGDGDLDAFVANSGASNHVWLNDGSGHFVGSGRSLDIGPSTGVGLGDLDGDGDLDAFVANYNAPSKVLVNDGNGAFIDTNQALGSGPGTGIGLGDLDGDGDLDAFVANSGAPHRLWLNDGSGNFTDGGQTSAVDASSGIALGDLDGDGFFV